MPEPLVKGDRVITCDLFRGTVESVRPAAEGFSEEDVAVVVADDFHRWAYPISDLRRSSR